MITKVSSPEMYIFAENSSEVERGNIDDNVRSALEVPQSAEDDEEQKAKEAAMKFLMDGYLRELLNKSITEKPDDWEF